MHVLAARIGCDNTGVALVKEGDRVVRRRWRGPVPPPPFPWQSRGPDLLDLVRRAVNFTYRKYRVPRHFESELTSSAQLSVAKALKAYERSGRTEHLDGYLMTAGIRGCVDATRIRLGRTGNPDVRNIREPIPIESKNLEIRDVDIVDDGARVAFELVGQGDDLRAALSKIKLRRHREVALRLASGRTMAQVGAEMGVTESRISQIAATIRIELEGEETWDLEELELYSVIGSWR